MWGDTCCLRVIHAIAYGTDPSRGLSEIAERRTEALGDVNLGQSL